MENVKAVAAAAAPDLRKALRGTEPLLDMIALGIVDSMGTCSLGVEVVAAL